MGKKEYFPNFCSTCLARMQVFPKGWSTLQNYKSSIILLHMNQCQLHSVVSFPLGNYSESYYFLLQLTQASSLMKAGKAHAVCLSPREDCIFYLSLLGFIFTVNSWLKCNQPRNPPYVLSCHSSLLASKIKHRRGKKKKKKTTQHYQPSHKNSQTLVCYTENPSMCFNPFQQGRKQEKNKA